jgi:hypothetical protein
MPRCAPAEHMIVEELIFSALMSEGVHRRALGHHQRPRMTAVNLSGSDPLSAESGSEPVLKTAGGANPRPPVGRARWPLTHEAELELRQHRIAARPRSNPTAAPATGQDRVVVRPR